MASEPQAGVTLCLLAQMRALHCVLPLAHVDEIMRPLPVEPIAHAPRFVLGVAIVRGAPSPVIDCGALMHDGGAASHTRWVSVRCGDRNVTLAFEAVAGVRELPALEDLPTLLSNVPSEMIAELSRLDDQLLLVLRDSRLVPEALRCSLDPSPTREGRT
jgi:purine-binding chemotaxis protein CheW